MSRTRTSLTYAFIAAVTVGAFALAPLAFAENPRNSGRAQVAETSETEPTNEQDTSRQERVEAKRAEVQAKLDAIKQQRQTKLDEKRLAACEKKADRINAILDKRSAQATKHIGVFKKISDRVQQFVTDKNLRVENYEALVADIEDKEAAATAAVQENTDTVFDCDSVDGADPGSVARASVTGVRDALKAYRTSIKNLIVEVKAGQSSTNDDTTDNTEESAETETDTSTGEAQ